MTKTYLTKHPEIVGDKALESSEVARNTFLREMVHFLGKFRGADTFVHDFIYKNAKN